MQSSGMQSQGTPDEIHTSLPPGQRALTEFPRFGIVKLAKRQLQINEVRLEIFSGALTHPLTLTQVDLGRLPRATLTADFHCAAGWSYRSAKWSGFWFRDVWTMFIKPMTRAGELKFAILKCQDRYRTSLPVDDLLAPDVLIADRLDDEPLTIEHGAPLRLIAPAHYGYKSAKHLIGIELRTSGRGYRTLLPRILEHPRARVAFEERGQLVPGWVLRYAFRPFIRSIIRDMKRITTHPKLDQ